MVPSRLLSANRSFHAIAIANRRVFIVIALSESRCCRRRFAASMQSLLANCSLIAIAFHELWYHRNCFCESSYHYNRLRNQRDHCDRFRKSRHHRNCCHKLRHHCDCFSQIMVPLQLLLCITVSSRSLARSARSLQLFSQNTASLQLLLQVAAPSRSLARSARSSQSLFVNSSTLAIALANHWVIAITFR